ncbi:hypothetical protein LTR36_009994 [Oleoguttula mirabilis]|uniref:NmrA-like domain-containing protein n=1 Tax=Oleoguttula mirabilis TaxID=1507867 RepID=A0AAV9JRM9_9PEZI|nr:hypothetical protein LTR36_009994 [Oleoguttula mirabilis]
MASIQKIVLAGATGSLGKPMLEALLDAKYEVTVFTRLTSDHTFPPDIKVVKVDYTDVEGLTAALQGTDALIITVTTGAVGQQKYIVDAAVAAGIKRIIPSEFGCDISNPKARALPVYARKVEIEEYIEAKCKGTPTTYTYIFNNAFLDWGIDAKSLVDVPGKKIDLYDGGETRYTATPLSFVAKGTVACLQKFEETANRAVKLHGAVLTQKKLLQLAQKVVGTDGWEVKVVRTEDVERESWANLKSNPGDTFGWVVGFLKRAIFAEGYGGDFTDSNDNQLLGLKQLSDEDVVEAIRARA